MDLRAGLISSEGSSDFERVCLEDFELGSSASDSDVTADDDDAARLDTL
jgi:hypothetical protein